MNNILVEESGTFWEVNIQYLTKSAKKKKKKKEIGGQVSPKIHKNESSSLGKGCNKHQVKYYS